MTEPHPRAAVGPTGVSMIGFAIVFTLTAAWIPPRPTDTIRAVPELDLGALDEAIHARAQEILAHQGPRGCGPFVEPRRDFSRQIAQSVDNMR